jgi:hypothetical protein
LLNRLQQSGVDAVVGIDAAGYEQPLQLALRPLRLAAWSSPQDQVARLADQRAGCSMRCGRIGDATAPNCRALGHRHT